MKNTLSKYSLALIVPLLLLLVIFSSGCVSSGGGQTPTNYGNDLLKLSIDTEGRTTMDSLENFMISVSAQNVGAVDAENVQARLEGYDGITSNSHEVLSDLKDLSPSTIEKPNTDQGLPGGTGDVSWDVTAPYVPGDSPDREITMTADVLYDTKSLATQRIVVATKEYVDSATSRGEQVPVSPSTNVLNGPVSIGVNVGGPYIKLIGSQTDFRLLITLDNDGTGSVYNRDFADYDYLNKIVLKVPKGLDVDTSNCDFTLVSGSGISAEKTLIIDQTHNRNKLRLTNGGSHRDLSCRLIVNRDYVSDYNTFDVSVNAYYTYLQSVTRKIVVKGAEVSPLQIKILAPTRTNRYDWVRNATASPPAKVEVLYENQPVTTGLSANNFTVWLENTPVTNPGGSGAEAGTPLSVTYDAANQWWEVYPIVPDMGTSNGIYDLTAQVKYKGYTASTVQPNAVNYTTV